MVELSWMGTPFAVKRGKGLPFLLRTVLRNRFRSASLESGSCAASVDPYNHLRRLSFQAYLDASIIIRDLAVGEGLLAPRRGGRATALIVVAL